MEYFSLITEKYISRIASAIPVPIQALEKATWLNSTRITLVAYYWLANISSHCRIKINIVVSMRFYPSAVTTLVTLQFIDAANVIR